MGYYLYQYYSTTNNSTKMKLTKEEKDFLIHHLKGELTWTLGMKKQYPGFDSRYDNLVSILGKLGAHPLKDILEGNKN